MKPITTAALLLAAALLLLGSTASENENKIQVLIGNCDDGDDAAEVKFETIDMGYSSGVEIPVYGVFLRENDFCRFWTKHNSKTFPVPDCPTVDYDQDMVIDVFRGLKFTGGYSIEVTAIEEYESQIVVRTKTTDPPPDAMVTQALTQPFHIIRTKRSLKPVCFDVGDTDKNESFDGEEVSDVGDIVNVDSFDADEDSSLLRSAASENEGKVQMVKGNCELSKDFTKVQFGTIEKGYYSAVEDAVFDVLFHETDFCQFWAKHKSNTFPVPDCPDVDFDENMVIDLFRGMKSTGGYSIEVTAVEDHESQVVIRTKTTDPPLDAMVTSALTQPFHIIYAKKNLKPVCFDVEGIEEIESLDREEDAEM